MFSGAKHRIKQWRQKKAPPKIMACMPRESTAKQLEDYETHLLQLKSECETVIEQLNQKVMILLEIGEDTSPVQEKIWILEKHLISIEKGLQDVQATYSVLEIIKFASAVSDKTGTDIEELQHKAASLYQENKKLRTELQIFQDHLERSEVKAVELEIQVEHLKFMNTLPAECESFLETEEKKSEKEDDEKITFAPKVTIPFLEEDESHENASYSILKQLDTLDFSEQSRLKILFDLIKTYIQEGSYDIAIPLLKSTIEDLAAEENPHDKNIFTMMEVMANVYNMTDRYKETLDVQTEILQTRKHLMSNDQIGLAKTLSKVAVLYTKIGKVKAARVFSREALDIKHKVFGENDFETAKELHNLGVLYCYDKQYSKGIDCMLSAFATIRSCSKRNVFALARIAANVMQMQVDFNPFGSGVLLIATAHILNDELYEGKKACNATLKFLHRELGKMLEGKNVTKDEILDDKEKMNAIPDDKSKKNIIKFLHVVDEMKEKLMSVSHVSQKENKDEDEKYNKLNISTSEEE